MAGFEPAASFSQISSSQSPDVASRHPMWRSPGEMLAGCRLTSPGGCARWLPTWLPPSRSGTGLLPVEQSSEFRKQDQGVPLPTTEPVKIANLPTSPRSSDTSRADFEGRLPQQWSYGRPSSNTAGCPAPTAREVVATFIWCGRDGDSRGCSRGVGATASGERASAEDAGAEPAAGRAARSGAGWLL